MSINDWLVVCVVVASAYARSPAALLFCALYLLHMGLESIMSDAAYYSSLILIDSALAIAVTSISSPSRATIITGIASGSFLVVNVAGFAAWFFYLPPAPYDAICSVIYIAMMAALINEGSNGCRVALYDLGLSAAHSALRKGLGIHHKGSDKI